MYMQIPLLGYAGKRTRIPFIYTIYLIKLIKTTLFRI
jgi:hypothetical protein